MKKRNNMTILALVICLFVLGNSYAITKAEEDTTAIKDETQEDEEFADDGDIAYIDAEIASIVHEHAELMGYLKNKDYRSAEEYIHNLAVEQMKEQAGDIEAHLTTVELTSDNFEDYFECVKQHQYNGFGEVEPNMIWYGVRSKKYDEGLVVYDVDRITVELNTNGDATTAELEHLLRVGTGYGGGVDYDTYTVTFGGRITDGSITFIDKDYIESYIISEKESPADLNVLAEITLKNGEVLHQYIDPEYPY